MWVVFALDSGQSTEAMRFATRKEAKDFIASRTMPWEFGMRWESDSPHPQNRVALGQVFIDGQWMDYARDTPEEAIRWARKRDAGTARVVDWVGRAVMWP